MTSGAATGGFLHIDSVVKTFEGVTAVDRVSLDVAQGEIFALLGSSGCGKTTLLRMVAGFEQPTSGRILLEGKDLVGQPPYERPLNMMFQSYALFPHLNVEDNVAFGLRRAGLPAAQIAERVDAMLKLVQLSRLATRKPHQLSGGQQQRVALARSLAGRPRLLLLDEPLGALDRKLREETRLELVQIIRQVGVTCLLVTHDQDEAMTMASRMAVMHDGRIEQVGSPTEIYETPASRFVADFIGTVNLMEGTVEAAMPGHAVVKTSHGLSIQTTDSKAGSGARVALALRPERIRLTRFLPTHAGANVVKAVVREKAYFGSSTQYHLQLPSGAMLKASAAAVDSGRELDLLVGDEVWAHWGATAAVVLQR